MNSETENHVMFKKVDIIIKSEAEYPTGAVVVDGYDKRRWLMAHPFGEGPQFLFEPALQAFGDAHGSASRELRRASQAGLIGGCGMAGNATF